MKDSISVAVRIRPLAGHEPGPGCVACDEEGNTVRVNEDSTEYRAARVYGPESTQSSVYMDMVHPLVSSVFDGYHACVFAYGQTGSGKTHTMIGPDGGTKAQDGVIPRTASSFFQRIREEEEAMSVVTGSGGFSQFQVRASYVEIYNNKLVDLLASRGDGVAGTDADSNTDVVCGVTEHIVTSTEQVLNIIKQGSKRRATAATGMNETSSRSHAVFTLLIEHRWRDPADPSLASNPRKYKSKIASFNLVDLAGSEQVARTGNEGQRFQESVAINIGLLSLHRVLNALAQKQAGKGKTTHIPYRDSTLTYLLQNALGGDCRTVVIACASPSPSNINETTSTLRYAQKTSAIVNHASIHISTALGSVDPMENDCQDPDTVLDLNRRTGYMDTGRWGRIFMRLAGNPRDPLILFVHGSGPRNSSLWWNRLIFETAVRARGLGNKKLQRFYMVAIDCPGYGRSVGDKQDIRSYPSQVISAIIHGLGKKRALMLVGSSQGCAAVFNAVVEQPDICQFLAVMDPVTHDPSRFSSIKQPALMCYDIDDPGHPVKVGRVARKIVPNPYYHEFDGSREPYWRSDHFAQEMLAMMAHEVSSDGTVTLTNDSDSSGSIEIQSAGGLVSWVCHHDREWVYEGINSGLLQPPTKMYGTVYADDPRIAALANHVSLMPVGEGTGGDALPDMFQEDKEEEDDVETEEERNDRLQRESLQTACELCQGLLWQPYRVEECRHVFCSGCAHDSVAINPECPSCGGHSGPWKQMKVDAELHERIQQSMPAEALAKAKNVQNRRVKLRKSSAKIVVEFGNTADVCSDGKRYDVCAFLKIRSVTPGSDASIKLPSKAAILRMVTMNINPQYPQSAIKMTSSPYELKRTMAIRFPCDMTLIWHSDLKIAPICLGYTIQHAVKKYVRRLELRIHAIEPSRRKLPILDLPHLRRRGEARESDYFIRAPSILDINPPGSPSEWLPDEYKLKE